MEGPPDDREGRWHGTCYLGSNMPHPPTRSLPSSPFGAVALVLLMGGIATPLWADGVTFSVQVDRPVLTVGETGRVDATLSWRGAADSYSVENWTAPRAGDSPLNVEGDQVQTSIQGGQPEYRRRVSYTIRALEAGSLLLSPAKVTLKSSAGAESSYSTQGLTITVTPLPPPWWTSTGALGVLAVFLASVAALASRRQRPQAAPPSRARKAKERVEALRSAPRRNHQEFFSGVLEALRNGLAQDWDVAVKERTPAALIESLESAGFGGARSEAAGELVTLCEDARFNPDPPPESTRERALSLLERVLTDHT